ncbi:zf-HC2 domain-containing protein [Kineococcus sp. SYSU DK002]|uniref:zf-HC2 domain-containing protein n=1 Tax=Kineococcus sp. SYSU DK002 TaxID=3383123 RepID=UPI003D7EF82B
MSGPQDHRELREALGLHALGLLPAAEEVRLRAHLDGCAACRAELADLAPLAADLRLVDPGRLPGPAAPPRELGDRVLAAVREESVLRDRRRRRETRVRRLRAVLVPVAACLVTAAVAVGVTERVVTRPQDPPPAVAVENLPLQVTGAGRAGGLSVGAPAVVVPHTWGVEVSFEAAGFAAGRTYRAVVRTADGAARPAGEFLGVGAGELVCDMQAAVLRGDATAFEVLDETGATVLALPFPRA